MIKKHWKLITLLISGSLIFILYQACAAPLGRQVVPRDAFPVFDNPEMLSIQKAEAQRVIFDRDAIIGITQGNIAKAYPITIMGVHELGNDTINGIPIAISW